jgi:hypothetical protein
MQQHQTSERPGQERRLVVDPIVQTNFVETVLDRSPDSCFFRIFVPSNVELFAGRLSLGIAKA